MNNDLQIAIHRYAEDREIDYLAAQVIGERYGKKFDTQEQLVEWKQLIDIYLKSFDENAWNEIEKELKLTD